MALKIGLTENTFVSSKPRWFFLPSYSLLFSSSSSSFLSLCVFPSHTLFKPLRLKSSSSSAGPGKRTRVCVRVRSRYVAEDTGGGKEEEEEDDDDPWRGAKWERQETGSSEGGFGSSSRRDDDGEFEEYATGSIARRTSVDRYDRSRFSGRVTRTDDEDVGFNRSRFSGGVVGRNDDEGGEPDASSMQNRKEVLWWREDNGGGDGEFGLGSEKGELGRSRRFLPNSDNRPEPRVPWGPSLRGSTTSSSGQESNPASRYVSRSIGSRSVPSRPSIPGKFSKYSERNVQKNNNSSWSSPPPPPPPLPPMPQSLQPLSSSASPKAFPTATRTFEFTEEEEAERRKYFEEARMDREAIRGRQRSKEKKPKKSKNRHVIPSRPVPGPMPDFDYQFSYSETPKIEPIGFREPQFSPFGPSTMPRPWTGKAPLPGSKKKLPEFDSFKPPPPNKKGVKHVQPPGPYPEGEGPQEAMSREEILGEPLTKEEINDAIERVNKENRQLNLGRDGLTHNMLDLIHQHWKRRRVCKIKCKGVPTVDMDNVCNKLEEKTGGVIIHRAGGVVYLFRGRNYNYKNRPHIRLMLWKPPAPIYPKLVVPAPGGLTKEEADKLRLLGRKLPAIRKLAKNGVYLTLVKEVKEAFEVDELVKVDCQGLNPSDYKKIGAKLKDLVPCVLLSFERESILMWRGRDLQPESSEEDGSSSSTEAAADEGLLPEGGTLLKEAGSVVEEQSNYKEEGGLAEGDDKLLVDDEDGEADQEVGAMQHGSILQAESNNKEHEGETAKMYHEVQEQSNYNQEGGLPEGDDEVLDNDEDGEADQEVAAMQHGSDSHGSTLEAESNDKDHEREAAKMSYTDDDDIPDEELVVGSHTAENQLLFEEAREPELDEVRVVSGNNSVLENGILEEAARDSGLDEVDLLWGQAVDSGDAVILDDTELDPDTIFEKVKVLAQSSEKASEGDRVAPATDPSRNGLKKEKPKKGEVGKTLESYEVLPEPTDLLRVDELAKLLAP